jgi:hypothetical protein
LHLLYHSHQDFAITGSENHIHYNSDKEEGISIKNISEKLDCLICDYNFKISAYDIVFNGVLSKLDFYKKLFHISSVENFFTFIENTTSRGPPAA